MKLEDEIKQKKFRSEAEKLAVNILYTHGWLAGLQSNFFSKFDITGTQYNILRILKGQHPNTASINLLKERMLDKMCDASRLIERLRKKGLVKRKICPEDRRKADVAITSEGLNLLKLISEEDNIIEDIFKNLKKSEIKTLNELLDKTRW